MTPRAAFFLLSILPPAAASAADCSAPPAVPIAMLAALPAEVRGLLGSDEAGVGGIAEAGQPFSASDAIFGAPLPMRRFVTAGAGDDCYAVTLEHGGFAHYFQTTIVRRTDGAWRLAGTRVPDRAELTAAHAGAPVRQPARE